MADHYLLELNLRIRPRKWLKREKPDVLAVPDAPNVTSLRACRQARRGNGSTDFMADRLGRFRAGKPALPGSGWQGISVVERAGRLQP